MKKRNALTALLLLGGILMNACGEAPASTTDDTSAAPQDGTETSAGPVETEKQWAKPDFSSCSYGGAEVNILAAGKVGANYAVIDLYAESENGDTLNDAAYKRRIAVEDELKVRLNVKNDASYGKSMQTAALAGDDSYDFGLLCFRDGTSMAAYSLASEKLLCNLLDYDILSLDAPWWDNEFANVFTVKDQLYWSTGDITTIDEQVVALIIFNKQMAEDLGKGDFYQIVRDGDWTIDRMKTIIKDVTTDTNGDAKIDGSDRWGFLGDNPVQFYQASGLMMSTRQGDGYVIDMMNDRSVHALELIYDFLVTNPDTGAWTMDGHKVNDMWTANQALFQMTTLRPVTTLRDSEVDFGILPMPKLDDQQTEYASSITPNKCPTAVIPISAKDPERSAAVIEALAWYGREILTPANYDIYLKLKVGRDDASSDMLDIIFAKRSWDPVFGFNCGSIETLIKDLYNKETFTFASDYAAFIDGATAEYESLIRKIYG